MFERFEPRCRAKSTAFKTPGFGQKYRSSGSYNPYRGSPKSRPGQGYPSRKPSSYPSGGSFKPAPQPGNAGFKHLGDQPSLPKGLGGFVGAASALYNADPASARRRAARANAFLSQLIPWDTGPLDYTGWGYTVGKVVDPDHPLGSAAPPGWTLTCNTVPPVLETQRKMGINPGNVPVVGGVCNVSAVNTANKQWGSDVPAGSTRVDLVCSGAAWPNLNGRPYWTITHPVTPAAPAMQFGYAPRGVAMPLSDPFPDLESAGDLAPPPRPPRSAPAAWSFEFGPVRPRGPSKTPHDKPPVREPPPKGTKEQKWKVGKGGPIGDAFGHVTEALDALDCAFKAAGGHGQASVQNKTAFVLEHFDITDPHTVAQMIKCMALNQVTDTLVGKANSSASKAWAKAHEKMGVKGPPRGVGIKRAPSPFGTSTRIS